MFCKNCGIENPNGVTFCANCGTKIEAAPAAAPHTAPAAPAAPAAPKVAPAAPQVAPPPRPTSNTASIPSQYKPLSAWAYFGYQLLFSIPLVGFILLIVFSVGGARNINLRNFARSYWCALLIVAILAVLGFIFVLVISLITGTSIAAIAQQYGY